MENPKSFDLLHVIHIKWFMTLTADQGVILVLSRWLRFFSRENLLDQSYITSVPREEIITKGIILEVTFRSIFKISNSYILEYNIYILYIQNICENSFLRFETKCTLVLMLAGSTWSIGPWSNSQFPSLATLKSSFFLQNFLFLNFVNSGLIYFHNQKNIN